MVHSTPKLSKRKVEPYGALSPCKQPILLKWVLPWFSKIKRRVNGPNCNTCGQRQQKKANLVAIDTQPPKHEHKDAQRLRVKHDGFREGRVHFFFPENCER